MTDQHNDNRTLSRRRLLSAGACAAGAAALVGLASMPAAAQAKKASQKDAGYQESPMGGKSCENCRQFKAPNSCTVVESPVSGNGYCRLYAKKA
jgi:secreted PhoX family phosphatase